MDAIGGREYCDVNLAKHAERNLNIDDSHQTGRTELVDYERARISVISEVLKMNPPNYVDRGVNQIMFVASLLVLSHTL